MTVILKQNGGLTFGEGEEDIQELILLNQERTARYSASLDVNDTRVIPFIMNRSTQPGRVRLDIDVEIDGNVVSDLGSEVFILVGSVPEFSGDGDQNLSVLTEVSEDPLATLVIFVRNSSDKVMVMEPEIRGFTALRIGKSVDSTSPEEGVQMLTLPTVELYPGEIRSYRARVMLTPDQYPGRYTVQVRLISDGQTVSQTLLPISDGRNEYDPPILIGDDADGTGLYVEAITIPEVVNFGASADDPQVVVWVENLQTEPIVRDFEVTISQTARDVRFAGAEDLPYRTFAFLRLGPQEGAMLIFPYEPTTIVVGQRNFVITVRDRDNSELTKTAVTTVTFGQ
ncbi:MAG: hypothetical protein MUF87_20495 [Anaerolineae bacterium]|nr:hypothetical protein [Anaerolineae bacterium]